MNVRLVYRVLFIDADTGSYKLEEYHPPEILGPLDLGVKLHLEKYRSWECGIYDSCNVVVIGRGVFAGGKLVGTHRLAFVFRSPHTKGLHASMMGGAAYKFMRTGLHGLVVEGRSEEPAIIFLEGSEKGFEKAYIERMSINGLKEVYAGYAGRRGVFALTLYLLDRYRDFFVEKKARAIVVGPAALTTMHGGVFSIDIIDPLRGELSPGAVDSAARGGAGSILYQAHGIVAIVFGGAFEPSKENPRLADIRIIEEASREEYGKTYTSILMSATKKYRFDPSLKTGGTFGVNYVHYRDLIPVFAYNMIYYSKSLRTRIFYLVLENFWKPFQKEVFESPVKPWYTCGEPCPVVCKKVWRGIKADYEPFNALGPLSGILRLEDAARLVELVDSLGMDAIEAGHIVSWLLDAVHRGLLEPLELGLPSRPCFDPLTYSVEECSGLNRSLAEKIIRGLVEADNRVLRLVAEEGIRAAARKLDEMYSHRVKALQTRFEDIAVYAAFGEEGYMTPNLYWAPGMVAPLYVLGRYWTNYAPTFAEPEEHAETSLSRALNEYLIDNAGLCRFHRGWAERMLAKLYRDIWGVEVNLEEHAKKMYRLIIEYQSRAGAEPVPWDSRKTMDMVASMAAETGLDKWVEKYNLSGAKGLYEWWERFRKHVHKLLGVGEA
ncbi:MAG: aldehyde ferredoxin oxidoreductase N-terminal domain-containing protein [Pyrodictiaceae archaeon]